MYHTNAAHVENYFAQIDREEAAAEYAREMFGDDWENNSVDPDFRRFIPASEVDDLAAERAALVTVLDIEAWEGFHN